MISSQYFSLLFINKEEGRSRAHSHNSLGKALINRRNLILVNTKAKLFYGDTLTL